MHIAQRRTTQRKPFAGSAERGGVARGLLVGTIGECLSHEAHPRTNTVDSGGDGSGGSGGGSSTHGGCQQAGSGTGKGRMGGRVPWCRALVCVVVVIVVVCSVWYVAVAVVAVVLEEIIVMTVVRSARFCSADIAALLLLLAALFHLILGLSSSLRIPCVSVWTPVVKVAMKGSK